MEIPVFTVSINIFSNPIALVAIKANTNEELGNAKQRT